MRTLNTFNVLIFDQIPTILNSIVINFKKNEDVQNFQHNAIDIDKQILMKKKLSMIYA